MSHRSEITRRQFIQRVAAGAALPAVGLLQQAPSRAADAGSPGAGSSPGPVEVGLSGTRTAFTVEEPVELAVLVTQPGIHTVEWEIQHSDGSLIRLAAPFPTEAPAARMVTLLPRTLKPGDYTVTAQTSAGRSATRFSIYPAENANAFWCAKWGSSESLGANQAKGAWMYFSGDLNTDIHIPRKPTPQDPAEVFVASRLKAFSLCTMGGGHQLDLDEHNDWGDPWVQRAIVWKMQLAALTNRIYPMAGIHCFDEPGETWWPIEGDGANPFSIPIQLADFKRRTGKEMPYGDFTSTLPTYAPRMEDWLQFAEMRLGYLEQAWTATVWSVDTIHPAFETINQVSSSYAPGDTTDGVDSRQNRAYRIMSGHGGYSFYQPTGSFAPVRSVEAYWGWSWDRPHYYLPMWSNYNWANIRQEVWMPWVTKLDGMMYFPGQSLDFTSDDYVNTNTIFEIAELNRRMALVGGVMSQLPKTLSPVAVINSTLQGAYEIAVNNYPTLSTANPPYDQKQGDRISIDFYRVMDTGITPNWIDEYEAAQKGADFLKQWKVVYTTGLATATPEFHKALEGYVAAGGRLIQNRQDKLRIPGATLVDYAYEDPNPPKDLVDLAWRKYYNELAPTFASDLAGWLGEQPYRVAHPRQVMLGVHRSGEAVYLLMANNTQDPGNPRHAQKEMRSVETTATVPASGVVYDLFNGGAIEAPGGIAALRLGSGDAACWLHLPEVPGRPEVSVRQSGNSDLQIAVSWGKTGFLPFQLRILDPEGKKVDEIYRSTTPGGHGNTFTMSYPLGANALPGDWTVELHEWLTGTTTRRRAPVHPKAGNSLARVNAGRVSIYFEDDRKIRDLLAGACSIPPYDKLYWDTPRVFDLDPKRFAVFGPEAPAQRLAAALQAKGMTVTVNPAYSIKPFEREPGHGGTGPIQDNWRANFEDIYAHTIVLPDHPLAKASWDRGHINRPVTSIFPGPGRAFVQWGKGCYQAAWENVYLFGDMDAGVDWLLDVIQNASASAASTAAPLDASVVAPKAANPPTFRAASTQVRLAVQQEIRTHDTPVGIASSSDGSTLYVLLYDGTTTAYDPTGKQLWTSQPLIEGGSLALSPQGDRLAVCGYPGLLILNTGDGSVMGGYRLDPQPGDWSHTKMISTAWSSDGSLVTAGWIDPGQPPKEQAEGFTPPPGLVILDRSGKLVTPVAGISGSVMGVRFAPGTHTLLVGASQLLAVDAAAGATLWKNDLGGAQSFAFASDGRTAAAGGWGKRAGRFNLADGTLIQSAGFETVVGSVEMTPGGDLIVAAWGGVQPLWVIRTAGNGKPEPFFQSDFAFQCARWSPGQNALLAAEQGGRLWLLGLDGKPRAMLEDAGTTPYRLEITPTGAILGRMSRSVQRIA